MPKAGAGCLDISAGRIASSVHSNARQHSLKAVLRAVIAHKTISRAELSRRTGLSKQTSSDVVRELIAEGWLHEAGHAKGNIGRSALKYELNSRKGAVVGADLGGTNLSVAIADLSGTIITEKAVRTDERGGNHVRDQLVDQIRSLAASAEIEIKHVLCAAIAVPGAYDRRSDVLSLVSNISHLNGANAARTFQDRLPIPFLIENDVTMGAGGELWCGAGSSLDSFVFLAMGAGTGLGIVSQRQFVRGARGAAGEIAWLPIGGSPFDSRNFQIGTLERCIGSSALVELYQCQGGSVAETVTEILDGMAEGDAAAVAVINETARTLAQAILAICAVLDPEKVIIGGRVGSRTELVERVRASVCSCMPDPVPIEASILGPRAALIGAVAMANDHVHEMLLKG